MPRITPATALALLLAATACSSDALSPEQAAGTIAFTRANLLGSSTLLMGADGTGVRQISDPESDEILPTISPDGRRVAFVAALSGVPQIFVMDIDGSNRRILTGIPGGALFPSWSPDGRTIYFEKSNDLTTWSINQDGTDARRLNGTSGDEQLPMMSPDGSHIVFVTARHFSFRSQVFELYVMNADGSDPVRITTSTDATSGFNAYASWSPDGRKLAFIRSLDGSTPHVWVVNADGSEPHQLLNGANAELGVTWSPDGRMIGFSRVLGEFGDIFAARATDGGGAVNLTNTPGVSEDFPNWGRAAR